jgi:hypothetical protein
MLAGLELPVFPCGPDKRPLTKNGFKDASFDADRISEWWRRHPDALVGVPTGCASGIDVLDVDRGGEDWLALYEATHGPMPPTRIVGTRSGGVHYYWQHRVGMKCSAGLLASNIDIRSTGGYVIDWSRAGCRVLSSAPIALWPAPMLELLHEATEARRSTADTSLRGTLMNTAAARHEVPKPLYLKVCNSMAPNSSLRYKRRVLGLLNVLVQKTENRNHALNSIGFAFRELISAGVITRTAVESLLIDASTLNGYIEKRGRYAADRTIRSGLGPVDHEGPTKK